LDKNSKRISKINIFLKKNKIAKLKNGITNFSRKIGETWYESWGRPKVMCEMCLE
jgi:hypothetical protein